MPWLGGDFGSFQAMHLGLGFGDQGMISLLPGGSCTDLLQIHRPGNIRGPVSRRVEEVWV